MNTTRPSAQHHLGSGLASQFLLSPGTRVARFSFQTKFEDLNPVFRDEAVKMSKSALREKEDLLTAKQINLVDQIKTRQSTIHQLEIQFQKLSDLEKNLVSALATLQEKKSETIEAIDQDDQAIRKDFQVNQDVTDDLASVKWCLRYSADKPYAVMSMPEIRNKIGLTTPREVRLLSCEECIIVLHEMDNLGLGENPMFPDEILLTGKGVGCNQAVLQERIMHYLLIQDDGGANVTSASGATSASAYVVDGTGDVGLSASLLQQIAELQDEAPFSHPPCKKARHG